MTDEAISLPKEAAQRVFDALVNSMDFGSGFLETDDVKALRELAVAIGVDPNVGTPSAFKGQYPHPYEPMTNPLYIDQAFGIRRVIAVEGPDGWTTERNEAKPPFIPCNVGYPACAKPKDHSIHTAHDARKEQS